MLDWKAPENHRGVGMKGIQEKHEAKVCSILGAGKRQILLLAQDDKFKT
jgi:hypothetical protein